MIMNNAKNVFKMIYTKCHSQMTWGPRCSMLRRTILIFRNIGASEIWTRRLFTQALPLLSLGFLQRYIYVIWL